MYILGVRERSDKLVRELVLDDPGPFVPLTTKKRGKGIDYEAKTVMLAGRRYIVCRNHQEAEKDAADRAAIVAALERQLAKGDKALIGNTGFRRYLKTISGEHFAIDPDKIEEEQKFDGIFVLRTNTDLNPLEAMSLLQAAFDGGANLPYGQASLLHAADLPQARRDYPRPRVLQLPRTGAEESAGGPHCSARSLPAPGPEIPIWIRSTETEIAHDGKRFIVRSAPRPAASLAIRAAGVALPPTVREATAG